MHILVARIGRVGDTVMMTPALNAILKCYPDAEITIIASPEGKLLLNDFHPGIKRIWTWDRHGIFKAYTDRIRLLKKIADSKFDKIFCFDESKRIASLFDQSTGEFYWCSNASERKHCSRYYLDLVASCCDIKVEEFHSYLPVNDAYRQQVDQQLAAIGIMPDDIVVMMHPTYSGYTRLGLRKRKARIRKSWPADYYGQLGKMIAGQTIGGRPLKPLIDLLPRESSLGRKIVDVSGGAITLTHSKPFGCYKALIARADLLLSPDSGPMHIASALGTPVVAFFSMRHPLECGPYMDPSLFTALRSDDPKKCISTIDVNTVYDAILSQLERSSAGRTSDQHLTNTETFIKSE